MGALDELLGKWRDNPDSGTTLALCTYLGNSRREDLVREVGSTAEAWHKEDGQVMLAVGRMYLDAGLLQEAQAALVAAGKVGPSDPSPYRYLGEVLLRRGDAGRAEKVLARALQMGTPEPDTRMWHDRAVVYVSLQKRVGMRAVADEIERTIPKKNSIPPPTISDDEADRLASGPRPGRPVAAAAQPARLPSVPPPPRLVPSVPPPVPHRAVSAHRVEAVSQSAAPSQDDVATGRFAMSDVLARVSQADDVPTVNVPFSELPSSKRSEPPQHRRAEPASAPPPAPALRVAASPVAVSSPRTAVAPAAAVGRPAPARAGPSEFDDSPRPAPETVLEHLARVGLFEKGGGAPPAWVTPVRDRPRGTWIFALALVLAAGGGSGAFFYVKKVRTERMAMARRIELDVTRALESGQLDALRKTDEQLSRVFDLDSRSQQAAILWLRNRVLSALLLPGEPRGIESALARCKTLGVDEAKTAFGKITSFLAEGDLAGAAAILPRWDEKAKGDAFYHLAAGALLERAGDVRAVGRYKQAFELDPDLLVARAFHSALVTLELGIETGKPVLDEAVKRLGDGAAARALQGLAWAADPGAGAELPESARLVEADRSKLPTQLLAIPHVVDAQVAARAGRTADALAALERGLRVAATPSMATWIGLVAIELGDEQLARTATLRALSYSALYPRARALAARVALLAARLEEAKKAIQELDVKSPEVLVVRAAAAYEAMDLSELESAVEAMGPPTGVGKALALGMDVTLGKKAPDATVLEALAVPSVPWGDLLAVDAALDDGNLVLAEKIASRWGERASVPTYALRRARLLRYQGKAIDAEKASAAAVVPGSVTPRVLVERFLSLLAAEDVRAARDLLAQYPAVLGPMTDYLKVSVDVADGKAARAKAMAARLEPPPEGSPLLFEILAVRALAGVGDRRAKPMVKALLQRAPRHPDLVNAAK